jgi:hypothetical protein
VYISSGLRPGERVITRNQLFIYDALNDWSEVNLNQSLSMMYI